MKRSIFCILFIPIVLGCNCQTYYSKLYDPGLSSIGGGVNIKNGKYFIFGVSIDSTTYFQGLFLLEIDLFGQELDCNDYSINFNNCYSGVPGNINLQYSSNLFISGISVESSNCYGKVIFYDEDLTIHKEFEFHDIHSSDPWRTIDLAKVDSNESYTLLGRTSNEDFSVISIDTYRYNQCDSLIFKYRLLNDSAYDVKSMEHTSDGGIIIGGTAENYYVPYSKDPVLIKLDSIGNMEWYKNLGSPFVDYSTCLNIDKNGKIIVGYNYAHAQDTTFPYLSPSYKRIKFAKYNNNGYKYWERLLGPVKTYHEVNRIIEASNGDYIATGYAYGDSTTASILGWIFRISSEGDSIWYREYSHYNITLPSQNILYDIIETPDKGLLAVGHSRKYQTDNDYLNSTWVLKVDSVGCEFEGCDPTVNIYRKDDYNHIRVYPNPTKGIAYIQYPSFENINLVEIVDNRGLHIANQEYTSIQSPILLDLRSYNTGFYILKIHLDDAVISRKILKL